MELLLPLNLAPGLAGYRMISSALLLVTDYMCLIQKAFPAIRFEWRFSFCFFILNLNFILLPKESWLKKDSLGILFFYEILLTNWGLICVRCYFTFDIKFYCKKLYNIYYGTLYFNLTFWLQVFHVRHFLLWEEKLVLTLLADKSFFIWLDF